MSGHGLNTAEVGPVLFFLNHSDDVVDRVFAPGGIMGNNACGMVVLLLIETKILKVEGTILFSLLYVTAIYINFPQLIAIQVYTPSELPTDKAPRSGSLNYFLLGSIKLFPHFSFKQPLTF